MSFKPPKRGGWTVHVTGPLIFIFILQDALNCILERVFSNLSRGIEVNRLGSLSTVMLS